MGKKPNPSRREGAIAVSYCAARSVATGRSARVQQAGIIGCNPFNSVLVATGAPAERPSSCIAFLGAPFAARTFPRRLSPAFRSSAWPYRTCRHRLPAVGWRALHGATHRHPGRWFLEACSSSSLSSGGLPSDARRRATF